MSSETWQDSVYRDCESKLNDFKNVRITYTEFIDWHLGLLTAAKKEGARELAEKIKKETCGHFDFTVNFTEEEKYRKLSRVDQALVDQSLTE